MHAAPAVEVVELAVDVVLPPEGVSVVIEVVTLALNVLPLAGEVGAVAVGVAQAGVVLDEALRGYLKRGVVPLVVPVLGRRGLRVFRGGIRLHVLLGNRCDRVDAKIVAGVLRLAVFRRGLFRQRRLLRNRSKLVSEAWRQGGNGTEAQRSNEGRSSEQPPPIPNSGSESHAKTPNQTFAWQILHHHLEP